MNNPYKIIGLSFLVSIIGIFGLSKLAEMLQKFSHSDWIISISLSILSIFAMLANLYVNANKLRKTLKSNN